MSSDARRILYCHCAYARVVPPEVKAEVLANLAASGVEFDAVPDLCELSARRDPALKKLASEGRVQIVACYPRAINWLFAAAEAPLPNEGVEVLNMREQPAEAILHSILGTSG
jgi:heterodisulfide reductase subunit A-like polyferredoxin